MTPAVPPQEGEGRGSREMLAAYLGLRADPAVRPDPRADLLWIVPVAVVLAGFVALRVDGAANVVIWALIITIVAALTYAVALRVRFMNAQDDVARARRRAVVRRGTDAEYGEDAPADRPDARD